MNIDFEELKVFDTKLGTYVPRELLAKAQADADRRLELLRRCEWIYKTGHKFCPICFSYERNGHADDCELAKELDDAKK